MKFHKTSVNFSVLKIFQGKFPYYAGFGFMVIICYGDVDAFCQDKLFICYSASYRKPTYELTVWRQVHNMSNLQPYIAQ